MIITPKKRTIFVLSSMAIAVLMLMLAAYKFKGWESAAVWSYGFASIYLFYAILFKDKLMIRFLIFTVVTGFTELLADNWLVNYTHTLVYPPNEPFLQQCFLPCRLSFSLFSLLGVSCFGPCLSERSGSKYFP